MQKLKYLIYIAILTYLIISIKELIKMRKAKNRIEQLEISNRRLQKNYDSIRSFKHDFNNIMQSMGGYIALKDMDGLEKMYKSIVKECQEINLKKLKVNDLDLCRVLGILIDNAIEASRECEDKFISIKFLHDKINNRDLIIVENSCKNCLIDINKIYEKGFSSKREKINHGLGLWKVRQILRKNKNIQIYTARDKLFKQQLEIY